MINWIFKILCFHAELILILGTKSVASTFFLLFFRLKDIPALRNYLKRREMVAGVCLRINVYVCRNFPVH